MKIIRDLDELEKGLDEYVIYPSSVYSKEEMEINSNMYRGEQGDIMNYSASQSTGIRWAVERIKDGLATLDSLYLVDNKIVSISITTTPGMVTYKSVSRSRDNLTGALQV